MKVVVNDGLVNYGLSELAYKELGLDWERLVVWPMERQIPGYKGLLAGMAYAYDRTNPKLVACVEKLGDLAGVRGTFLMVIEFPDDKTYEIIPRQLWGEDLIIY